MSDFNTIPIRFNADESTPIDASWFNIIRTRLIDAFGSVQGQTQATINDSVANQNIAHLVFDRADFRKVVVQWALERSTDDNEIISEGIFTLLYYPKIDTWKKFEKDIGGDDPKLTFSLFENKAGGGNIVTVRYTTTNLAGANHVGDIFTKVESWAV